MTKQPPYAARLRLSRICRWLLAIGVLKLCILGSLTVDFTSPQGVSDALRGLTEQKTSSGNTQSATASSVSEKLQAQMEALNATPKTVAPDTATAPASAPVAAPSTTATAARPTVAMQNTLAEPPTPTVSADAQPNTSFTPSILVGLSDLDGTAAASQTGATSIAAATKAKTDASVQNTAAQKSPLPTPVVAKPEESKDTQWWSNILQIKSLPFPRWGVQKAAYAATLATPPPPMVAPDQGASPFMPPAQAAAAAPKTNQTPLPPQASLRPQAAGSAGPQFGKTQGNLPASLVPNSAPPTPNVQAYTPPEDPNRRQQELARREQEVLMLKQQMEERLKELNTAERKMQDMLREAKVLEDKKLASLVGMYTNMKPKQAAKAIESLDERIAVKILRNMSPKQSGDILSYTNPQITAKLTEVISRMRMER